MRAAFITQPGPREAIRPASGARARFGHVLVKVRAAAVNQVDAYIRSGRYRMPTPFPFIVGRDLWARWRRRLPGPGSRPTSGWRCNSPWPRWPAGLVL